ncbi:MAG: class I SAM-dependent methyltransferase [Anaerolineaceae bacterium]
MKKYVSYNSKVWDLWSGEKNIWTVPVSHEQFVQSQQGNLVIYLTPEKPVPAEWYTGLGRKVLGLASGGGQQSALLTAHGYEVTILDNSKNQLESDRMVAEREGYPIKLVRADMTRPFPFEDGSFDFIVNPVSNCYIADLTNMWHESFRVLKKGGALMTGFTNPLVYLFDDMDLPENVHKPIVCVNPLPFDDRAREARGIKITSDEGYQFSHTLEKQLRGQMQAGFLIKDLYEDTDTSCRLSQFTSLYMADLAVKP